MEMSPFPELTLAAADNLRRLVPDGSHMQNMATYINDACGNYRRAVDSNSNAIRADDKYFVSGGVASVIFTAYRAHNIRAIAYAAMMAGQSTNALYAARHLPEVFTPEILSVPTPPMVEWTEWQLVTLPHVLIHFG
ncbi:hypothetical protein G6011_01237 [Alternaria panax]|uniref:Uncharacterized protein n=1 Tax=Alternaria panax TaxID=48097 RepID=A0AAD4NUC9_9PLEO|nr:hypothetical protein G6011_01237 [Alternaria panax]